MFLISEKIPKLITKLGYDPKDHEVENDIPSKRKRSDSKFSSSEANDSMISDGNSSTSNIISSSVRHKLRRTKKHENLRDEWKKYHNNFIPVIDAETANSVLNSSIKIENSKLFNSKETITKSFNYEGGINYEGIKKSIKDNFNQNNYKKIENNKESELKDKHIAKKRRLFSLIQH